MRDNLVARLTLQRLKLALPLASTLEHALRIPAKLTSSQQVWPEKVEEALENPAESIPLDDNVLKDEELSAWPEPSVQLRGNGFGSRDAAEDLDAADSVDGSGCDAMLCESLIVFYASAWCRQ